MSVFTSIVYTEEIKPRIARITRMKNMKVSHPRTSSFPIRVIRIIRGFVAETNATHVFLVRNGEVATSRVGACPEEITRVTVLEICAAAKCSCAETDLTLEDVCAAEEMFCTGTMGELVGVVKVDDRVIGRGEIGPADQTPERSLSRAHREGRRSRC
jgi:branched-subunit amino acid aminotransferase/4-amino-4-deoxychorismate lyase